MKRQDAWFTASALTLGLVLSGCGFSRTPRAEPAEPQATPASAPTAAPTAVDEPAPPPEPAVLERDTALPARAATSAPKPASRPVPVERPAPQPAPAAVEPEPEPEPAAVLAYEPRANRESELVMVRLPADTELPIELRDTLSSETNAVGDAVRAVITEDIVGDGLVAIPAGSEVRGSVVEIVQPKKIGGQARIGVRFDEIATPSGYRAAIDAGLEVAGKSQKVKDGATIGGAAAGGAILGRVLSHDKGKGTLLGGILGAAAGTVAAHKNKVDAAHLDAGMQATLRLEVPIHVAVADPGRSTVARN